MSGFHTKSLDSVQNARVVDLMRKKSRGSVMAKRFTDTNKYKKPFIRSLPGAYKLFWDYLYHDCDHAGIWIVDFDVAQIYIGVDMPIDRKDAISFFNDGEERIIEIDDGKKWFIRPFIDFQYGELNPENRAHNSVIKQLSKHSIILKNKPLTRPLQGAMDMDMDKDMDKDKENRKKQKNDSSVNVPDGLTEKLSKSLKDWIEYRKQIKKPIKQMSLDGLIKKHSDRPADELAAMIEQSIANGWQGIFELKEVKNHGRAGKFVENIGTGNEAGEEGGSRLSGKEIIRVEV